MARNDLIDAIFIERLTERYTTEIQWRIFYISPKTYLFGGESPLAWLSRWVTGKDRAYKGEIAALQNALAEVKVELERLSSQSLSHAAQAQSNSEVPSEECQHWKDLLQTHVRVIRVLELDEAKMGTDFPINKRIDMEERRKRVGELQQQIAANCG